jgi:hypothetical protein
MQGGRGLRKLRWLAQGKGKRGGARVIYYSQGTEDRIYLIYGYTKPSKTIYPLVKSNNWQS